VTGLRLRELVKHYSSANELVRAVDGISLDVAAGEFVAISGASGAGKTTLLMLAAGIMRPDSGSVWFDGQDIAGLDDAAAALYRRRDIGFVFQSFQLMGGASAVENAAVKIVADGFSPSEAREHVEPWIKRVGLGGREDHLPGQLSTGERQRVAIARALANEPRVLLADEPTGNLDSHRGREILTLFQELAHESGVSVVLATHDPQAVEFVDTLHTMRDGRLERSMVDTAVLPGGDGGEGAS
jgi:putative ABC transport system ATP-binding protein